MLASRPSSANCGANSLPTGLKVCNLKNRRVNLNYLLQSNEHRVSHRSVGTANELPAMVISIVRYQQNRL